MMKKILLAGVAITALAVAAPANAADLRMPVKAAPIAAPAPYFSWTGCYVGAHVGHGWGTKDTSGASIYGSPIFDGSMDISGEIFGGQLGCNMGLAPNWLIGIEGSVSGADIQGFAGPANCCFMHAKADFLASITGKLGWTGWDPRVMFYVKGGVAWAHDEYIFSYYQTNKETRTGWVLGFGAEWALPFAPSWTVFAEYDHYDFGSGNLPLVPCPGCNDNPGTVNVSQQIDTVRIGANYKFGGVPFAIGKGTSY